MAEYSKNMKFTFHVLGVPHTKTTKNYVACAFTQKVYKFCRMMTERGHTVIHYGTEGSDPVCTENVNVLSDEIWQEVYGEFEYKKKFFQFDQKDKAYQTFFKNAVKEIRKRKGKHEFLLPFWGTGVRPICDELKDELIVVEPGIGYSTGGWAQFRVFESYAIMHNYFSLDQVRWSLKMNWYDRVIPNYFDLDDFEFNDKKEDYFLFLGRVFSGKGIHIATDMCQRLGVKLKIAGQLGDKFEHLAKNEDPLLEYVGYAKTEQRKELMKNAMGFICPSMYAEPFCGTQVEAMLSGTPVISQLTSNL